MPTELEPQEKTLTISAAGSDRHEFIKSLAQKVRQDDDDRQVWKDKQVVAYNLRLGLRRKTNRPYPGASEVPIPITDKFITKLKSMFVSVATLMKKQIVVTLDDGEVATPETKLSAERIERALNNLIHKRDFGWAKKVTLFVDYFLENGHAVFKIIEKFFSKTINRSINIEDNYSAEDIKLLKSLKKADLRMILAQREEMDLNDEDDVKQIDKAIEQFKSGKKVLTFVKKEIYSEPTVIPERGLRIIVPSSGTETQRLPRICHDMWMTYQELREKANKGIYDKKVVDELDPESGTNDDDLTNTSWAVSEGVSTLDTRSELFNVRECQTYYKNEKWVFTWIEQAGNNHGKDADATKDIRVLQEMKLPYAHGLWTYVKHDYEMKNTRWYSSRGVPEKIRGLHQTIEKMYNARLIRDELNNAPMWRVSKQLGMAGDEIRMRPGQVVEAESGEIEMLNKGITTDVSSERLEQQAKTYAEEYLSITDFSNRSAVNQGAARTATELQLINQASTRQVNMDISLFLDTLSEVAQHMYLILKQSVDRPMKVGGVMLRPEDFLVKIIVAWSGSLDATDAQMQMARAMQRMQVVMQLGQPVGVVTPINVFNMLQDYIDTDPDVSVTSKYITAPQHASMSQVEDQQEELVRILNGFDVVVNPDDDDNIHLQVIEEWAQTPQGAAAMQNEGVAQLVNKHVEIHIQSEQMKNGIQAQKAAGSQGAQGDPRAQRAAQAAR
jgi:hypothetical protein